LRPLPTRDAVIVMIGTLLLARREGSRVSELVASLPRRFTASDRLQNVPVEGSRALMARFGRAEGGNDRQALEELFGSIAGGRVRSVDHTDGARATFDNGRILHLRPSGNAPEFRCYAEAETPEEAESLCARALEALRGALQ
jgi:phosphomannomutase